MMIRVLCYALAVLSFALLLYSFMVPGRVDRTFFEACALVCMVLFLRVREKMLSQ